MKIGIVGAGLAGLSFADEMVFSGHQVVLFDKGRGPGGRMSTRRLTTEIGKVSFDHGAPYFTAQDRHFREAIAAWEHQGLVQQWPAAGPDAWVGVPSMNAVVKQMASRHEVLWNTFAQGLIYEEQKWHVATDAGLQGPFETLVVATPAEQAAPLLSLHDLAMARHASLARSKPCWVSGLVFAAPLQTATHFLRDRGVIALALCNRIKPQRAGAECWVVYANTKWSTDHLEMPAPQITQTLLGALLEALEHQPMTPIEAMSHRWRYAHPPESTCKALWNPTIGLGACGDWLLGPRAECAWLSGHSLARIALNCSLPPVSALRA